MILLFGNAFGAQATAYQLTGGALADHHAGISSQIRGDVLHNPGLGYAAAMGMVVIMAVVDRALHRPPAALRAVAPRMTAAAAPPPVRAAWASCATGCARRGDGEAAASRGAWRPGSSRGSSSSRRSCTSSLPLLATFLHSIRPKLNGIPDTDARLPAGPRRRAVLRRARLLVHRRRHHDHRQPADHRPDRLLGPAASSRGCGRWSSS